MLRVIQHFWTKKWDWDFTTTKAEFWEGFGLYFLSTFVLVLALVITPRHAHVVLGIIAFVGIFWLFVMQFGMTSLSVRRAHDAGISGAWTFIPFAWIIIGFLDIKTDDNWYRASGIKCKNGHDQFADSIWCVNCQTEGFDPRLESSSI